MSMSSPNFKRLNEFVSPNAKVGGKYEIFFYCEDCSRHESDPFRPMDIDGNDFKHLGGTPVLFIPGNAGSYNQGRSFASLAANTPEFDWFLIHFDEDLSAFHGKTLLDEARYANDAISYILKLYEEKGDLAVKPSSVIVVAHSMGGVVARTLVTLDNYIEDSVNTIITLSTPHAYPPITFDRDVTQLYDLVGRWWRYKPEDIEIALVSITGGHNDPLVLPDMTIVDSLGGLSAFSYEIAGVGLGIDHLAIVWCAELRQAVIEAINEIADFNSPTRTLPYTEKLAKLNARLKHQDPVTHDGGTVLASNTILWGKPLNLHINKITDILLPARSSLLSYRVDTSERAAISHHTGKEFRNYENVDHATLVWYTAGPYIPFTNNTERLILTVDPLDPSKSIEVRVRLDFMSTLANIALHYRTIIACWPFSIVLMTLMVLINAPNTSSVGFGHALYLEVMSKWYVVLAMAMSAAHCALTIPAVRTAVRAFQFPSESENVKSLAYRGFSVHDLLLGVNDPELFWIVPILLSVSVCAVVLSYAAASIVVVISNATRSAFNKSSAAKSVFNFTGSNLQRPVSRLLWGSLLMCVLYLLPYQVSTALFTAIQLLKIQDRRSISFGFNQLLLWTTVVDAPIIAVWVRNLTVEWLWAFASLHNIASSLPIAIYVLCVTPSVGNPIRHALVRKLTLVVMAYMTAYSFLHGGLHAFMLHHLTNYLMMWLIVANFGS